MEGKANRVLTEAILMNVFNYFFYFTYQFVRVKRFLNADYTTSLSLPLHNFGYPKRAVPGDLLGFLTSGRQMEAWKPGGKPPIARIASPAALLVPPATIVFELLHYGADQHSERLHPQSCVVREVRPPERHYCPLHCHDAVYIFARVLLCGDVAIDCCRHAIVWPGE